MGRAFARLAALVALLATGPPVAAQPVTAQPAGAQPASAQQASASELPRREASAIVGASFGDGETAPALSAALGFRITRLVGVEFELAYARKLDFTLDLCPAPLVCVLGGQVPVTGRTVSLVPHLLFELPTGGSRVHPHAVAGLGVTHLRQWHLAPAGVAGAAGGAAGSSVGSATNVVPVEFKRSELALTLSFGGGVAVDLSRRFTLGAEVRAVRLFGEEASPDRFIVPAGTMTMVRVGSRVSYRF